MRVSAVIQWLDVRGLPEAYRLVALFRASNPMLGGLQPEELHWELSWVERFVPVDMDLEPETRASVRAGAVSDVALSCAVSPDAVGPSIRVGTVPHVVRRILLDGERGRLG